MHTKEAYYANTLRNRELAADPEIARCTCPNELCEWHERCRECVALHRHFGDHIPACLQPILVGKIEALAGACERITTKKPGTPEEYRLYVRERDAQ